MLRTRDFVLVLTVIGFLLVSVGVSFLKSSFESKKESYGPEFVEAELGEIDVELYEPPETFSREERLESMRQKIAQEVEINGGLALSLEEETPEQLPQETEGETETENSLLIGPVLCPNYTEYKGAWSPYGISFDIAEGARVAYREIISEYELDSNATSGTELPPEIKRDVVMELPAFPVVALDNSCIYSDVIGIANDGSLIKNSESGLYSIFSSETLIGYALDGYPIYGSSPEETDECGWGLVDGQYGYYLSSNRETILNCFVGTPISTPFLY